MVFSSSGAPLTSGLEWAADLAFRELCSRVLLVLLEVLPADSARIYGVGPSDDWLVVWAQVNSQGEAKGSLAVERTVPVDACLCGVALREPTHLEFPDVTQDPRLARGSFCEPTPAALLLVPLRAEGHAYGVLRVARQKPGHFSPVQVRLTEAMAQLLAHLLHQIQELHHALRRVEELEALLRERTFALHILYNLSQQMKRILNYEDLVRLIQSSLSQVLDFDLSASLLVEDLQADRPESVLTFYLPRPVAPELKQAVREEVLRVFSRMGGQSPDNLRTVELHGPDYRPDDPPVAGKLESFFHVPLIVEGKLIGMLSVSARRPHAFDEHQVRLLYTVAAQAAETVQRLQNLLERERAHLTAVVAGLNEGVLLLDGQDRVLLINPAAVRILEALGQPVPRQGEVMTALNSWSLEAIRSRLTFHRAEVRQVALLGADPGPFVQLSASLLDLPEDQALLLVLRDVTQEHLQAEALRRLSVTDPLTGLANRRHFFEILPVEIARARRYRTPLSLIILDVDNLKQINDTYGHLVGDEALKQVARVLSQQSRLTDVVARYAGDEFVLLLPHTSLAGAVQMARRLLDAIVNIRLEDGVQISASLGVAVLQPEDDEKGQSLLARADNALYQAKQSGRGRIVAGGRSLLDDQ